LELELDEVVVDSTVETDEEESVRSALRLSLGGWFSSPDRVDEEIARWSYCVVRSRTVHFHLAEPVLMRNWRPFLSRVALSASS
jgi:hypothetical protein